MSRINAEVIFNLADIISKATHIPVDTGSFIAVLW